MTKRFMGVAPLLLFSRRGRWGRDWIARGSTVAGTLRAFRQGGIPVLQHAIGLLVVSLKVGDLALENQPRVA